MAEIKSLHVMHSQGRKMEVEPRSFVQEEERRRCLEVCW